MAKQTKAKQPQTTVIEKITGTPLDLSKGKKVISNSTGWSLDIDLYNKKEEPKLPSGTIPGITAPLKEEKVSPPKADEQNSAVVKPIESSLNAVKGIESAKAPLKVKSIGTEINPDYKIELLLNANKEKNKAVKKYLETTPDNPDVKAKTDELMFVYTQGSDVSVEEMFKQPEISQEELIKKRLQKAKAEASKSPDVLKKYGADDDATIPYAIQKTSGEGVVIPQLMPKEEVETYLASNNLNYLLTSSKTYTAPSISDISETISSISKKVSLYEEKLKLDPYGDALQSVNKKAKELEVEKPQLDIERTKFSTTDEDILALNNTTSEVTKLIQEINDLSQDEEIIKYNSQEPSLIDDFTTLSEEDEVAYQEWRSTLPEALQYEGDYDLRGFYQENPTFKAEEGQHLTDKFKRSNHPTFSTESKYYQEGMPAGRWDGDKYIPENRSKKVTEYLTKGQRIMDINRELPLLKEKAQEKIKQYELTNKKELAYKKKLQEFNDLLKKIQKTTPDSFMNRLALKYKDKLTPDIIINEFTTESNRFRYKLLQSYKLVPAIPESADDTLRNILMSRVFQNSKKEEKIIMLNEYFIGSSIRKTDKQAFFSNYKQFIYTPLDITIIKQQALESKMESDAIKKLNPAIYKRPVNNSNLSDVLLSNKYDNMWTGVSPFDTAENDRKKFADELVEKIIAIPETESGIWNDFIKGIQNSSKKNWIPVLGGFIDYNEQRIIKDAFIAKNPTFEQKRLRKIFNDIAQVRAKFHQDDASWFDIGETLFPELVKFAMENTILNGILGKAASAFKDTVAQKTVIELAKKMKLVTTAEAAEMSGLPLMYIAKQLTKGAVASQTVALGTSLSQAIQMTIPAAQAMADPDAYSEGDMKKIIEALKPHYVNYIHSSLNQTIGFGIAGLGHEIDKPFGSVKRKLAIFLDDYFKVSPQRAMSLYEMLRNKEVQNTISLSWAYNQAKLITQRVGGVMKDVNRIGVEILKKAELQSFPAQTVEMHIMAIMHQQVGRYFDPEVQMPELSLYKTGVEAFKVMLPLTLTKTLFGASRVTLGVGLHMYHFKGTSKIHFDKVDMEMIGADFIQKNGLPIPTYKRQAKVAFESLLDKILKESRDEILDRDNYENILNEIDHIDTKFGEHKLAKVASRVLDFRIQFENTKEAEAGRTFKEHYDSYRKQKEAVEGFIISSSVKGRFDESRAEELLNTITEEIPRNELDYHISVCKEYQRLLYNNLIPDNITLGEFMAREGRKLLNIEAVINNYIYSGGVINFEKIRADIDNTVISRDKHAYLMEALDAAHTKYIRSENITVDGLSIISDNTQTKVQRRYSDTVKERSDKFTHTRGLEDANGNYNLKTVNSDVVFEDTVNPQHFIDYIVANLTHIPEPVRQVVFGTLGRNRSLSESDKKQLLDAVSKELETKLIDNKIEPEEAVKQMALINEGLEAIGSTYTVNEVGAKPTNGMLLYAYMKGRFHYNSANNRFFLDKYEFEEAMGVINASKNFSHLISTDAITSLENKCVTDSNYTVTDEVEIDSEGVIQSQGSFNIKNKTKLTEKHLSDWFADINNIDNFVDRGQKKAIIQMLLNTANNFVRFGIIDNTIDFLRLLPSVKTLNQRRKAKVTPEQINDDVLYQVKQEVKKQFTSRLKKAIDNISDKKQEMTGAQWIIEINKSANKGEGLSQDEMKWTGLREFLDRRADEVISRKKVEEVFNAGLEKITPKVKILKLYKEEKEITKDDYFDAAERLYREDNPDEDFTSLSEEEQSLWIKQVKNDEILIPETRYNKGSHSQWDYVTQIGGEGYKEVIFYIDNVEPYREYDTVHFGDYTEGNGALFWTRISDYTNEHGERVRFIEEIQSNRNQDLISNLSKLKKKQELIKYITDKINSGEIDVKVESNTWENNAGELHDNTNIVLSSKNREIQEILEDNNKLAFMSRRDLINELVGSEIIPAEQLPGIKGATYSGFSKEHQSALNEYAIEKAIMAEKNSIITIEEKIERMHNQFEGNNWKNLAAKWIINDAIANGIDKIELTGSETQVSRGGERSGHVQFYDVTMPNIFKKLGLEQGETKVITDGESKAFFYINGEKITEDADSLYSDFLDSLINDIYPELNKGSFFNLLSVEEKNIAIKKFTTPEYKDKLKEIYNEYSEVIDKIETIERKNEEGNTHTFTITDKTKETLTDNVTLFQEGKNTEENNIVSLAKEFYKSSEDLNKLGSENEYIAYFESSLSKHDRANLDKVKRYSYDTLNFKVWLNAKKNQYSPIGKILFRAIDSKEHQETNQWQYYSDNYSYASTYGEHLSEFTLSNDAKILNLLEWQEKLDKAGNNEDINPVNLTIHRRHVEYKNYEYQIKKIEEILGKEDSDKFKKELQEADVIFGFDEGVNKMEGTVWAIRNNKVVKNLFQIEDNYIQGYFEHLKNQIVLLKDANFSTLVHELGHSFRFMLKAAADSGNTKAAERLKAFEDFALGEEGKKFFDEQKIEGDFSIDNFKFINELWARSFEKYLYDGTAKGIKDVNFKALLSQFRDWMKEIYLSIKNSALNIKLTPEVRDVFESIIGNKNKLFELKEYIIQRLGRPSWRKHLTAELVREIIEKMKTSRLDPETHQESMLLLNEVINHYKRQYVANKYKANSRLINPDLQKLMYTPKFLTVEGYEKHIELFTKILNDARFKWSWINMGKNLIRARRRVLSNRRENIEFYTALSELTKVEVSMFTKQKDIEDFTALLNYKPNDVGISEFKSKVQRFTDMSSEYKKELYKDRLEKEARAKDENEDEVVPTGISDLGLSETRAEREKNVNATREYAVQVGNVDTMKETESVFFGLDTSRMTDSELNHYNSIMTNVIRSKGKFEVTNEIVEFSNVYTARLANESLEESISDYWRLKLKELNYKATNVNPITRNLLNRALNPHGFGVLSNYNLRDTLNFLDGIVDDYSGEIVKTIFEPLSQNHDKMRTILNGVFGKINAFKNGKERLKEGAFHKVGIAWLLYQKPEIKIEANDLDPNKNSFIDEETGVATTIWEKVGLSEEEVRKNFLPDEVISPEEFYEKDNNGVWNLKENLTPLQESRYAIYKKLLDLRLNYLKDSIMISFGEKPDNMSAEEFESHLREMTKTTEFLSTSRHVAKFGKPSFFDAAVSEIQSKRLSLLEATGFNSVKEFLQSDIELSNKESEFMALGVSLFDQLQDGQFSGGRTMKETAEAYTANNIVPYVGIRNYAPILRFNTTELEQTEDVLGTMPGQQKTGEFMGVRTGLNTSNNFVKQRKQNVSTINTNAFEMIEKRFDQELFYILHEPHRIFLRELLNKKTGLFGRDKNGNSKEDSGKVDNITTDYIRNMIALYYRRGATNAKLKVRNSPGYSRINSIVNDYKIASLGLVRNSFAQTTSTWMAQENLLGTPLERIQDIANGYGDVFGGMASDVIGTKSDADNMIETYAQEVAFRGLTDYNLGTGKQSPTLGSLMKSYRDGSMDSEQGYFGNLLRNFKDADRSRERVLLPMVFFDRLAARATFFGAYRNYCRHQGIELSYKNPDIDAINFARDVVRATQHTDNELFKPGVLAGVSARENANPFSDNNFNDNSALFELLRSGYWNFKSFTLVEKNNMAIKLLKAINKDGVHGTMSDKIDYATALAYNITGNMLFNYAKSVAKAYMSAISVYTAYNMGLGRPSSEDDNESILSKLIDGDWSEMNHINTQAKNKAADAKNEIWDIEVSASDDVTMSDSEKKMHGLFYNTMKSVVGQYGLNEISDYAFRHLMLYGHNKLSELSEGGELDEKFVKMYAGADKIDFLGLYSGLFALPYLIGAESTDKNSVSSDFINLANSVGPGKDVEPEHLISALQFVTSALGYGIYSKYPLHYPAINKWMRENRKEELTLKPEDVEHLNSLDNVQSPVNQSDGQEDETDNDE